jgi:molybdopterin converting factor small subunit/GNAT superfamily N-acetyltransferase
MALMTVTVLLFAQARERAGSSRYSLELPEGSRVSDALAMLERDHPGLGTLRPHLAVAVDRRLAPLDTPLSDGCELALLPPVSGGVSMPEPRRRPIRCLPATPSRWRDLELLFGPRGACAGCWCMWPRLRGAEFARGRGAGNRRALRRLVSGNARPGIIAYRGGTAVGWCGLAPREEYRRLERSRVMAPVDDRPVWSVVCFFVAPGERRGGITTALLRAAVDEAARRGATIVEGYPLDPAGRRLADAFAWFGLASSFRRAGFEEVARRSPTRPIMRRVVTRRRDRRGRAGAGRRAAHGGASRG